MRGPRLRLYSGICTPVRAAVAYAAATAAAHAHGLDDAASGERISENTGATRKTAFSSDLAHSAVARSLRTRRYCFLFAPCLRLIGRY